MLLFRLIGEYAGRRMDKYNKYDETLSAPPQSSRCRADGMAARVLCLLALFCATSLAASTMNTGTDGNAHQLFTNALQRHVKEGLVDYEGMAEDSDFQDYLQWLGQARPSDFESRAARMAFWVNAYNAHAIKGVLVHSGLLRPETTPQEGKPRPPGLIESVQNVKDFFDEKTHRVAGKDYSLNQIEKDILLPRFRDARLHFVLVCAAMGCPALPSEAFTAENIEKRMQETGRQFLNNPAKNRLKKSERTLYLSQIFNWYLKDFEQGRPLLDYVKPYLSEEERKFIEDNEIRVRFLEYDWSLNKQP